MRLTRLPLIAIIFVAMVAWPWNCLADIRTIDFKNFSFPWTPPSDWPDHLQWMSLKLKPHVELVNGRWDERNKARGEQFSGLTLEGVQFAKLSDEEREDAIVVLRYDSGGTQYHYWVYIYTDLKGTPKLLGILHTGDRAYHGLYQIFEKDRTLNVRLFDPKFREGDCYSSGYLTYQFRWNGKGFEATGTPLSGRVNSTSRRPVSVFGIPTN